MKRPERQLYIPPALRSSFDKGCEDKMEKERWNRQAYLENRERLESSSSSNPRSISDNSSKDEESSDFEECSIYSDSSNDQENGMDINEISSNDYSNEGAENTTKNNHTTRTAKFPADTLPDTESNEAKADRGLFFHSDESSISDIESMIDDQMKMGRVLTSTPHSDIEEQKVLDAAKYDPVEESGLEATLLGQSDNREITVNTDRDKCDYNFEIYHDPSSVTSQPTNFSDIFGNNYIPPPVAPSLDLPVSRLPPIHRLPSPFLTPHGVSVFRHVSPHETPQLHTQSHHRLRHPQFHSSVSSSLSLDSSNSSPMASVPRHAVFPSLQPSPNPSCTPPSIPPPHSPQERCRLPHPPQDASNLLYLRQRSLNSQSLESSCFPSHVLSPCLPSSPLRAPKPLRPPSSIPALHSPEERFSRPHQPQDEPSSLYLHQQNANFQSLEYYVYKQDDPSYIPPPVPPVMNRSQQIRNFIQCANVQSSQPNSISTMNRISFDDKIWPQN